ncbi:ATP-dependent DNA helicase MER3 homolog isoform X1 [Zingiber officinale]|uniref:ATP-dependent DNA helicase MER3 homolog isoform X1 n=2 Tax=Zingiber officinale TaxID=94328 RepID=UPI001C4BECE7|nr:ATP-dependent DNA helicase MER3 homolog isoform X1 [Zingiber officinale]
MGSFRDSYSLVPVSELPAPFRAIFSFRYFNSLQSECFFGCFFSDMNMVISAPTGSGKTVLFQLCILRLMSKFLSEGRFSPIKGTLKTIYIAPSKALVQEKLRDWNMKFGPLAINCLEMTSDSEYYKSKSIQDADIILTTPEKFDAVTRHGIRNGDLSFFGDISLVLIDEVHLLNDPRGASLEAIVSRIKMLSHTSQMGSSPLANVRFLAVSATIPNIQDIAEWLLVPSEGIKSFGEEMRPVKLVTKVFGYAPAKNDFLFERRLQNFIFDLLMQYSKGKSALVFCSTRKGAVESAQCLSQIAMRLGHSSPFVKSIQQQEKLKEASLSFTDKQMQSCIIHGGKIGYHNGGLSMKDRSLVEGLFLKGDIQILCTTNTLAHGINLPAHTVVVKSTQYFNKEKGLYTEYDRSMILQMCGRAGRPPFDDTGTVIIMTRRDTVHLYESLLNGCELVESQLLSCATEHLMAEIVQLIVSDISLAIEWLKCSYLHVRIKKNPENYGLKRGIPSECLEKHMLEICMEKIKELSEHGMVWTDEDGFLLKPLEPGRLMTKFYLKFNTMKLIVNAPGSSSVEDVLHIISRSEELSWIQLRRNEKKLLNDINSDKEGRLRFHVLTENGKRKKRIQTREEKIFVLANDCLTGDPLVHDLSFNQDVTSICTRGSRIAKCMKECYIYRKSYKGAISSILLAKCLHHKLWENSPYLLKQLPGIGMVTAKALQSAGVNSFESLAAADPRKIEILTGRKYPFGNHIKESLLLLPPKVEIKIEESECMKAGRLKLIITLYRTCQSATSNRHHYADILIGSEEDNMILFHEKLRAEEFPSPHVITIIFSCPKYASATIKADLIFEDYVGLDVHKKLIVTNGVDNTKSKDSEDATSSSSLPKEIYVVNPDPERRSRIICKETDNANKIQSSMPSFDLLEDETVTDISTPEPQQTECKTNSEKMIFDHIRKKSKTFPTSLTSTMMDYSHQPLLLRIAETPKNLAYQRDGDYLGNIIVIDSEPTDAFLKVSSSTEPTEPMKASIACYPSLLKRGNSSEMGGFEIETHSDVILIDSEPIEDFKKMSSPSSFLTEREKIPIKSTRISSSVLKSEVYEEFPTNYLQSGRKKPSWSDSLKQVQSIGCKISLFDELNSASDRTEFSQHSLSSVLGNQSDESFLGFKSVFSFL